MGVVSDTCLPTIKIPVLTCFLWLMAAGNMSALFTARSQMPVSLLDAISFFKNKKGFLLGYATLLICTSDLKCNWI